MRSKFQSLSILLISGFSIIGFLFILLAIFGSIQWIIEGLYPFLLDAFSLVLIFCIILCLPLSFFRATRVFSAWGFMASTVYFSSLTWLLGFIVAYVYWGLWGIGIGTILMGIGVTPIAFIASLLNSNWEIIFELTKLLVLALFCRGMSMYLVEKLDYEE